LIADLVDGRKRHAGCGIGRGLHAVAVNSDIYPCHRFVGLEDVRLGDVRNYKRHKDCSGKKTQAVRQDYRK